jgi:uncharacterized glyoxalase superfamily protein PhnB
MLALKHHSLGNSSPLAVSLRVENVRRAAKFYQRIGFTYVMSVPDENDEWLLCLLRYGSGSILLGSLDHPQFPRTTHHSRAEGEQRGVSLPIDLTVLDLLATYRACVTANCRITAEPVEDPWRPPTFSCVDPFGYEWQFTQATEATTLDQVARGRATLLS